MAVLLGLMVHLAALAPVGAQTAPATDSEVQRLAREYVTRFVDSKKAESLREFIEQEQTRVQEAEIQQRFPGYSSLDDGLRTRLEPLIGGEVQKLEAELKKTATVLEGEIQGLAKQWTAVRADRNQAKFEAEAASSRSAALRLASLVNPQNRWLWLAGLLVAGVFAALVGHENRRELRRYTHGYRHQHVGLFAALVVSIVVLLFVTLVTFLFGGAIFRAVLASGQTTENSTFTALQSEIDGLQPAAEAKKPDGPAEAKKSDDSAGEALDRLMKERWSSATHVADAALLDQWRSMRLHMQTAAVASRTKQKMAEGMKKDVEEREKLASEAKDANSAVAAFQTRQRQIRAGVGCGLILLTFAGAVVFARRVKKRREEVSKVCPMCLAEDSLQADEHGAFGPLSSVTCANVIDEAQYQECGFSFLSIYRPMEKLYIPTLGHPASGKTLWSAMVYRELIRGNYDESISFQKIRSRSAEDFDRLVEDIITDRVGPAATQVAELPHPLIFDFQDHDRYGKSHVLLSIFDYSGEVMQRLTLNDPQRRRALVADAYMVFCDPTQPSEAQAKELVDFAADVQALRASATTRAARVKLGRQHTPVAICVPKIDLLVNVRPNDMGNGSGEIERFYDELSQIDVDYPPMSLARLRARSDLVAKMWDFIWPGWRVDSQIRKTFGGRYMFFPLTPVGLGELGQTDLRDRILQPYGILEPLCWLLHMNGYPVLS